MTKPADSKQAIPSPEDRVRAIREKLENVKSGRWHKTLWVQSAPEDVVYLLSLVEELKGQLSETERVRQQTVSDYEGDLSRRDQQIELWMKRYEDAMVDLIAATAEVALLRKRKDYHAEYVEAVEAAEKARLRLVALEGAGNKLNAAALIMRCCADLKEAPDKEECQLMGDALRRWESALTPEPASQAAKEKP